MIGQLERRRKSIRGQDFFFGPSNLKSFHSKCKTSLFLSWAFSLSPPSSAVIIIIKCLFIKSHFHAAALSPCHILTFFNYFPNCSHCKDWLQNSAVYCMTLEKADCSIFTWLVGQAVGGRHQYFSASNQLFSFFYSSIFFLLLWPTIFLLQIFSAFSFPIFLSSAH